MATTYLCSHHAVWLYMKPREHENERGTQLAAGEPFSPERETGKWVFGKAPHYEQKVWVRRAALSDTPASFTPSRWWHSPSVRDQRGRAPFDIALTYRRTPYSWGGLGLADEGIDCSGLVHMAYRRSGVQIPRDSDAQEVFGRQFRDVLWPQLQRGDLITYGERSATHIAFWAGDGEILHATVRDHIAHVIQEKEPDSLRSRRRRALRIPR